jgi:hypothetical protein
MSAAQWGWFLAGFAAGGVVTLAGTVGLISAMSLCMRSYSREIKEIIKANQDDQDDWWKKGASEDES